jgi:ABC-2 type transport system ATP-binding protein
MQGQVRVAGFDVVHESAAARRSLGYLAEEQTLDTEFRVEEFLALRAALKGVSLRASRQRVEEVCHQLDLQSHRRHLISQLSKGYRQRVGLADALLAQPQVLLLDEPTDGLDPVQRASTLRLIADLARRHTVLLSTHVLPEAESICERLLILDRGRLLADGAPSELLSAQGPSRVILAQCEGPAEALCAALSQVPGVASVRLQPARPRQPDVASGGSLTLRIELADAAERAVSDRIARAILSQGQLLSLSPQPRSIASLFQQLTQPIEE